MIKEIKYNGQTSVPSDYSCPDGDIAVAMDLFHEDEHLRAVREPQLILALSQGKDVLYVHETGQFTHYIIRKDTADTSYVYWIDKNDSQHTEHLIEITDGAGHLENIYAKKAIGVGNTLIVTGQSDELYYILWKNDDYEYLGTHLPELPIKFGLKGEYVESDMFSVRVHSGFNWITDNLTEDESKTLSDKVNTEISKFIADRAVDQGRFIYPFFVRYAYRLFDGTLTMHSAPSLMVCSTDAAPIVRAYPDSESASSPVDIFMRVAGVTHQLVMDGISSSYSVPLQAWKDIIKSVDVFISAPIYSIATDGTYKRLKDVHTDNYFGGYSICKHMNQAPNMSTTTYPLFYQRNDLNKIMKFTQYDGSWPDNIYWIVDIPRKGDFYEAIRDTSNFYLFKSLNIENLPSSETDLECNAGYLNTLVNREHMSDDYDSHDTISAKTLYEYNHRLNLGNISKRLYGGFDLDKMLCKIESKYTDQTGQHTVTRYARYYVYVNEGGKDIVVGKSTPTLIPPDTDFLPYFYYPNPNASKLIVEVGSTSSSFTSKYVFTLNTHSFLSGSFQFTEFNSSPETTTETPSLTDSPVVNVPNKIYTSEVNNPFLFPVKNINTIGSGEIIALSSAAKPLSSGQFGQFPLYAFTTDGVWALSVSETGGYNTIQPISFDIARSEKGIQQLDSSVAFLTKRGLMHISGSQVSCISDAFGMVGFPSFDIEQFPHFYDGILGSDADELDVFTLDSFNTFISGAGLAFDYASQRVIVYNSEYTHAYLLSMRNGKWSMMRSNIRKTVATWPSCLVMTTTNKLLDMSARGSAVDSDQILVTRPLKLDAPDVMKTVNAIIQRGSFETGNVKMALYGSRDLYTSFKLIDSSVTHRLRGFSGTGYKYFVLVLKCNLTQYDSLSNCTIQYETKETNTLK